QIEELDKENQDREGQTQAYQKMLEDNQKQIKALGERLTLMTTRTGSTRLWSSPQIFAISNDLFAAEENMFRTKVLTNQLDLIQLQAKERRRQQIQDKTNQILHAELELQSLMSLHRLTSEIRSPFAGEVLEIMIKPNQMVGANSHIMSLQAGQEK